MRLLIALLSITLFATPAVAQRAVPSSVYGPMLPKLPERSSNDPPMHWQPSFAQPPLLKQLEDAGVPIKPTSTLKLDRRTMELVPGRSVNVEIYKKGPLSAGYVDGKPGLEFSFTF